MGNNAHACLSMGGCPFKTNCQNGPDAVPKSVVVGKVQAQVLTRASHGTEQPLSD